MQQEVWLFCWARDCHIEGEVLFSRDAALRTLHEFVANDPDIAIQGEDWIDECESEIERLVLYCGEAGYDMICERQS